MTVPGCDNRERGGQPGLQSEAAGPGLEINRAVDTVARSPGTQYNLDTPQLSASCLQSPLELGTNLRDVGH